MYAPPPLKDCVNINMFLSVGDSWGRKVGMRGEWARSALSVKEILFFQWGVCMMERDFFGGGGIGKYEIGQGICFVFGS